MINFVWPDNNLIGKVYKLKHDKVIDTHILIYKKKYINKNLKYNIHCIIPNENAYIIKYYKLVGNDSYDAVFQNGHLF